MAISGGDGSIILTTAVEMSGLKKGLAFMKSGTAKAFAAIGVASAAASVAITKMATSAYADYEQLVGGVETLFKGSADKVIAYAENAFATTGQSANEYMENVTAFSASLLSAVGGDTERAADVANAAMVSISDNVNKMGSSAESVQLAFQGFAKQQYMLLDNLKLGYGGTKTEMERLLKDAQAITGVEYNIDNLADVYTAIGVIQEKLGIAGTTAREAESTISGSAAMMKAAWQNTLTAISGGGDLDKAINNLVYSVQKYFENIVPVIERSLQGIGRMIEKIAPLLVQTIARALIQAIPSLLNAVYQMIIGLAKGIYQGIVDLFKGGAQKVVEAQTNEIAQSVENQNALTEAVEETEKAQKGALAGFDEINTLSSSAAESAEDLAMNTVSPSNVGGITVEADTKKAETQLLSFFNKIKKAMEPLIKATKEWVKGLNFKGLTDGLKSLLGPLKEFGTFAQEVLFWVYTNVLLPLSTWTINEFAPVVVDSLKQAFEGLSSVIQPVGEGLQVLFEELEPIIDWIKDTAIWIVEELGDVFSDIGDVFQEKGDKIKQIFEDIGSVVQTMWEIIQPIFDGMKEIVQIVFDAIEPIVGDLIDVFSGLAAFISGVFAGDWEKAWNGVVDVFKGIVNILIDALNIFIRGLNLIQFDFPDWKILGDWAGKTLGIDIPEIPHLAQGAVIPPNREFLAVLGDQKHGTNIEAPLDTIKQAVAEVLAQVNVGGGSFNGSIEVPVIIDGREVARAIREAESNMGTQTVFGGFANVY